MGVTLSDCLSNCSIENRTALDWFRSHAGQEVPWTPVLDDGTRLFTLAKGIYKPEGQNYARSVRQTLASTYPDRDPVYRPDGTWRYTYHQEGDDADYFTNKGLRKCIDESIPVGVARQVQVDPARYLVLGVALAVEYKDGFFHFEGFDSDGQCFPIPADGLASDALTSSQAKQNQEGVFDPSSSADARERAFAAIVRRRGQRAFRARLLRLYGGRCAVTKCAVECVLEAAHVTPYLGPATNSAQNGILLRADVHTLWDLGLMAIKEESGTVLLSHSLQGTEYQELLGRETILPGDPADRPSHLALKEHRDWCGL